MRIFRIGLDQCPHKCSLLLTCDIASVDVVFFRCELALENLDAYRMTVLLCGCLQSCSMHSSLALFVGGTKVEFTSGVDAPLSSVCEGGGHLGLAAGVNLLVKS